jgi:methylthioribose-1-phosphate isomerase
MGSHVAPRKVKVYNPAFDVTPGGLIAAIVTERGIFRKPYGKSLAKWGREMGTFPKVTPF